MGRRVWWSAGMVLVVAVATPLAALPSQDTTQACRDSPDTVLFLAMDADDRIPGAPERTRDCLSGEAFGDVFATWAPDGHGGAYFFGPALGNLVVADDADAHGVAAGQDFTLLSWIRVDAAQNDAKATLISKGSPASSASAGYALYVTTLDGGQIELLLRDADHEAATIIVLPGDTLDGAWHHVAFSVDRDAGVRSFVDGVEVDEEVEGPDLAEMAGDLSSPTPLTLGAALVTDAVDAPLFGYLDEVRLVLRALGTCEVRSLMLYAYDDGTLAGVDPFAPTPDVADALGPLCAAAGLPAPPPPPVI